MSDKTTPSIGKILVAEQARDAIHIAVAPVVSADYPALGPGQHIGLTEHGLATQYANHIGIVDPFLPKSVGKGERFWMFLYPGTITSLRHEWTHPGFDAVVPVDRAAAEARLRTLASELGVGYEEVLWAGTSDEFAGGFGRDIDYREVPTGFWDDIQSVTGKVASPDERPKFFRCAC